MLPAAITVHRRDGRPADERRWEDDPVIEEPVEAAAEETESADEQHPIGSMVLALAFLLLIVVLWLWTYAELIGRT